jgi:divinyl protochlorophyllide a 8-vinyl-reductase
MQDDDKAGAAGAAATRPVTARIGPNAITRVAEALETLHGQDALRRCFTQAGLARYLDGPPGDMVEENDVIALHGAGRSLFGIGGFAEVARLAGRLTGDYVLAHRIPRVAQLVLRALPSGPAGRILAKAIAAHAWTFAGSGVFSYRLRRGGLLLQISDSPLARGEQGGVPLCDYYAATFERIFRRLVDRQTAVEETACAAAGAPACSFEVRYRAARAGSG